MTDFLLHLNDSNPSFACFEAGDKAEKLSFTVRVKHKLNTAATEAEIAELEKQLGENTEQIRAFYRQHNGLKLYCQGAASALAFFKIKDWKKRNKEWKQWFEDLEEDELYEFQKEGIAFGEVSESGNYFVFYQGKVFYSDHDGGDDTPLGDDFNDFLSKIATEPAEFLMNVGCYTRYEDGKTDTQWIPKVYQSDK